MKLTVRQIVQSNDSIVQAVAGRGCEYRLVVNSSFLSRDLRSSVKTHQSSRRLAARLIVTGRQVGASEVSIMDDRPLKGHQKLLPTDDTKGLVMLDDAVEHELANMGGLLSVLIGTAKGLRPYVQAVDSGVVKELHLNPALRG